MKRVLLLSLLVTACGGKGGDAEPAAARVGMAPVRLAPFTEIVTAIGTVAARPGHFAELAAPAPTRVTRILAAPGQRVRVGDTLVVFEVAAFQAAANAADVALRSAENANDRALRLTQAGILPRKDADAAAQALADAQATAVTARRNAQLAALCSPLDGVVTHVSAVLGASVDASAPVVGVADPSAVDLTFALPPDAAARVHVGDSVLVIAGDQGIGDTLGSARIRDVGAVVDSQTRAVTVRAHLSVPGRAPRIGETVRGRIAVRTLPRALMVPEAALVPNGEGYGVFVVDRAGLAHLRPVEVGGRADSLAEILSGVSAGETVVTTGAYGIIDSARVAPPRP